MCRSGNFRTVFSGTTTPTHQMPSSKHILAQNDNSKSFKVICFGVSEEPLRGYIVQHNNCGLACEGSEDISSEGSENRHFRRPHAHLTPPLQRTPREHLHKSYFAINQDPWATFLSLTVPKARNANSLVAEPETDFNAKRPFKVIYLSVTEDPPRVYIAHYNNCGLKCEGSEDIAGKLSVNGHFRRPHSHLKPPLQLTPANIRINLILLETAIPGLHFCR